MPQSSTHPAPVATAEQLYRNRVRYVKSEFTPCWSDRAAVNSCSCARGDAAARCGSKARLAEEGRPLAKGRNRQQLRETRCRDFTCLPQPAAAGRRRRNCSWTRFFRVGGAAVRTEDAAAQNGVTSTTSSSSKTGASRWQNRSVAATWRGCASWKATNGPRCSYA